MAGRLRLPASLKHRDFRLMMSAMTISVAGSWAYNVALAVWIYERTGSASWVGAATIGRFVPALVFSAYGGVLAERFERVRLMQVLDVVATVVMLGLAVETALHAPVIVAILTAAVTSVISTVYEPASAAMTPQLVGERDLGSANALRNTIDNLTVVAGPGLGALLLLVGPPSIAIGVNSASYLISAVILARVRTRSTPVDVTEDGSAGVFKQMLVGVKAITSSQSAAVLVAYSVIATIVFGGDTVQLIVLSRDVLGTGADGYGYLLAGLGVGGVLAAGLATRLEKLNRLGLVILTGMAFYCLPTLLFLVVSNPDVAFAIQVIRGAGTLVVDVLAITALQRSLPHEVLGRVFGALGGMFTAAVLVGAIVMPILIGTFGLHTSLWITGAGVPVACLLGWPALRAMDTRAAARRAELQPWIDALAACDLFESVSEGPLEQLAGTATVVDVAAGQTIIVQRDEPDAFYVILTGHLKATNDRGPSGETVLSTMGPGDYFGEIGLIEQIARTATVTAVEASHVLRIAGDDFISALSDSPPSTTLLEGASSRLRRSHPAIRPTHAALTTEPKP